MRPHLWKSKSFRNLTKPEKLIVCWWADHCGPIGEVAEADLDRCRVETATAKARFDGCLQKLIDRQWLESAPGGVPGEALMIMPVFKTEGLEAFAKSAETGREYSEEKPTIPPPQSEPKKARASLPDPPDSEFLLRWQQIYAEVFPRLGVGEVPGWNAHPTVIDMWRRRLASVGWDPSVPIAVFLCWAQEPTARHPWEEKQWGLLINDDLILPSMLFRARTCISAIPKVVIMGIPKSEYTSWKGPEDEQPAVAGANTGVRQPEEEGGSDSAPSPGGDDRPVDDLPGDNESRDDGEPPSGAEGTTEEPPDWDAMERGATD